MRENHLWNMAGDVRISTGPEIVGNFDIGFDPKIPEETRDALMHFVYWVEDHFSLPVTLWVDFKYNHYLIAPQKRRVGYRFYWAAFKSYPVFENPDDIPVIELPVRMEHSTLEEILTYFIKAISCYYAWLTNRITELAEPDTRDVDEVLQAYLQAKKTEEEA